MFFDVPVGLVELGVAAQPTVSLTMSASPITANTVTIARVVVADGPPMPPVDVKFARDIVPIFTALGYRLIDHAGGGRRITGPRLVRLSATSPEWAAFAGTWGEDQVVRLGDTTLRDGAGPTGPTQKAAWRNPVGTVASWRLSH